MSVECAKNGSTFDIRRKLESPFPGVRAKIKEMDEEYNTCQCGFGTLNSKKDRDWAEEKFPDHQHLTYGNNFKAIYKPGEIDG